VVNDYDSIFQRRQGRKMKMNIYFVLLKSESGRKENTREKSENDFSCLVKVNII